jgi:hypothetical protein
MAAMSSGAPTAANKRNCPLNTVASRQSSGDHSVSRGTDSRTWAKDGPRLSAAIVEVSTDQNSKNPRICMMAE